MAAFNNRVLSPRPPLNSQTLPKLFSEKEKTSHSGGTRDNHSKSLINTNKEKVSTTQQAKVETVQSLEHHDPKNTPKQGKKKRNIFLNKIFTNVHTAMKHLFELKNNS